MSLRKIKAAGAGFSLLLLALAALPGRVLGGPVPGSSLTPPDVIMNQTAPQPGKTFSVSSGTVSNFYSTTVSAQAVRIGGVLVSTSITSGSSLFPSTGTALFPQGLIGSTGTFTGIVNGTTVTLTGMIGAVQIHGSSCVITGTITGANLTGTNRGDVTIATANGLSIVGQALSMAAASSVSTGALRASDFAIFDNKLDPNGDGSLLTDMTKDQVGLAEVQNLDQTNADNLSSGMVAPTLLGTGTPTSSTYLRGDSFWEVLNSTAVGLGNVSNARQVRVADYTQKGAILVGISTGVYAVLAPGNNGTILQADTSSPYGYSFVISPTSFSIYPASGTGHFPVGADLSTVTITGKFTGATGSFSGLLTGTTVQFSSGSFSGQLDAANLGGTNTGDVTLGSDAVANGASFSNGQILHLASASATQNGALTSADWTRFNAETTNILGSTNAWTARQNFGSITASSATISSATVSALTASSATAGALTVGSLSGVLKASAGAVAGSATTTDLPEGSNQYFTTARATTAVSATSPLANTNGVFAMPAASGSQNGYLTSTDFARFNSSTATLTSSTNTWSARQTFASILAATGTFTTMTASTGNFAAVITTNPWVDVRAFGAVPDDGIDDAPAFRAAEIFCETLPRKTLLIPPGTYTWATMSASTNAVVQISSSVEWVGLGAVVESNDSDYMQKAGSPNDHTGYTIINVTTANIVGILIQNKPVGSYKMQAELTNLMFVGPGQSSGTAGHGIVVDSGDQDFSARVLMRNVSVSNFGGRDIYLKQGYYGSSFRTISTYFAGLTGFYTTGAIGQGEWVLDDLRSFGNGIVGSTESDQAGLYVGAGSGILLNRISCTQNWNVQAMFEGAGFVMNSFQAESFQGPSSATQRCLIVHGGQPSITGMYFSPSNGFLGRVLDLRSVLNANFLGFNMNATLDATGYIAYEDSASGGNIIQLQSSSTPSSQKVIQAYTRYGGGSDIIGFGPFGSAAVPSYAMGNATDGLFNPGARAVAIGTNGTKRMEVDTTSATINVPIYAGSAPTQITDGTGNLQAAALTGAPNLSSGTITVVYSTSVVATNGVAISATNTNDAGGAGKYGQYISSSVTTAAIFPTSGQYIDAVAVVLPAGEWNLSMVVELTRNGSTFTSTDIQIGMSTTSGNSATGLNNGDNAIEEGGLVIPTTFTVWGNGIPSYNVKIASQTTYYLKLYIDTFSGANPKYQCRLSAQRPR